MLEVAAALALEGYLDELSATHAVGWARDRNDPAASLLVELYDAQGRVLAQGVADQVYAALGGEDNAHGFSLALPPGLPEAARDGLRILVAGVPLLRAAPMQGFVDQRSTLHAAGWVRDRFAPGRRLDVEAVLQDEVIATGTADRFVLPLAQHQVGDAQYGFMLLFPAPLTAAERDAVIIRPRGGARLPLSPKLVVNFELLSHAAVDIVNNCNLRCPFCLFDYSDTKATRFMSEEVFRAAIRLLPLVPDGGFWLSCLHEPSLHPNFLGLIDLVPREHRRKLMFTTNIAKRANDAYFEALAASGVFHINISIESRTPALYEKFRKGARFSIFQENWDRLIAAWRAAPAPPHLRYIIMAYRSNLAEIPALVRYLREERLAWHIEVRYTYDEPHIAADFKAEEYLHAADWAWLQQQLGAYPPDHVAVLTPDILPREVKTTPKPNGAVLLPEPPPPPPRIIPIAEMPPWRPLPALPNGDPDYPILPLNIQMRWDGHTIISDKWDHEADRKTIGTADIRGVPDPFAFLMAIAAAPLAPTLGFVDEVGKDFVLGWIRDERHLDRRAAFEVVLRGPDSVVRLGEGRADLDYAPLHGAGFEATNFGFRFDFPRDFTAAERDGVEIWLRGAAQPLLRAPCFEGFVNARSCEHVEGWVRDRFNPQARVPYEVFIALPGRVERLGEGIANIFSIRQQRAKRGEAHYAFDFRFPRRLTPEERDHVAVRVIGERSVIDLSPRLLTT
jgi:hypothetical protein